MKSIFRYIFPAALAASGLAGAVTLDEMREQFSRVERHYDTGRAEAFLEEAETYAEANPGDDSRMLVARAALLVAELHRLTYESENWGLLDRGDIGDAIDKAAKMGLKATEELPESSEKYRIRSDLYATMIRSKFKGKRYGDEMESSANKALELDPENPNAYASVCRRYLFAEERHGGDIEKALELLNKALEIDPGHERARVFRGVAYEKLDELEKAKEDWVFVLEMNPRSHYAIANLNRVNGRN